MQSNARDDSILVISITSPPLRQHDSFTRGVCVLLTPRVHESCSLIMVIIQPAYVLGKVLTCDLCVVYKCFVNCYGVKEFGMFHGLIWNV